MAEYSDQLKCTAGFSFRIQGNCKIESEPSLLCIHVPISHSGMFRT